MPKTGSMVCDTSKSAANQLVWELAIELAPNTRVNGVAPANVVGRSRMFPRQRVIASLKKSGIGFDEKEDTVTLRNRLAGFYSSITLKKTDFTGPANRSDRPSAQRQSGEYNRTYYSCGRWTDRSFYEIIPIK